MNQEGKVYEKKFIHIYTRWVSMISKTSPDLMMEIQVRATLHQMVVSLEIVFHLIYLSFFCVFLLFSGFFQF